jgi:hypothetical protein
MGHMREVQAGMGKMRNNRTSRPSEEFTIHLTAAILKGRLRIYPAADPRRLGVLAQYLARQVVEKVPWLFRNDTIELEDVR